MFSLKIVGSDAFLSLPAAAQALYFQLCMRADDDGFLNSGLQIVKSVGAKPKDLQLLLDKRFILKFQDNILLVKHWRMANSLKSDRLKPPQYPAIAASIYIKQNKSYTDHPADGCKTLLEFKNEKSNTKGSGEGKKEDASGNKNNPKEIHLDSSWIPNRKEENRTEKNRTEGNGTEGELRARFERFFAAYPKQIGAETAWEEWKRIAPDAGQTEAIMCALTRWKQFSGWQDYQYIPHGARWLRERYWEHPPADAAVGGGRELDAEEKAAIARMLKEAANGE